MMYETEYQSGTYQESTDSSFAPVGYAFNGTLSKCENGSKLEYDVITGKVMMYANMSDKCYVYFDKEPVTLASYITNLYTIDGDNGLYLHDSNLKNGANDNSLRYAGANPDNYVCFGSEESTCPNDNLYRIIGVFDGRIKLIKYDYANSNLLGTDGDYSSSTYSNLSSSHYKGNLTTINNYYWNINGTNKWRSSQLNTVNLNTNYINNIGSEWENKIAKTTWKVGGNSWSNIGTQNAATAYQNEIVSPAESTTYSAKIGMMYTSEYGFATSPENWTTTLNNYNNDINRNNNWMYMGLDEWTIIPIYNMTRAFFVDNSGFLYGYDLTGTVNDVTYAVRPTFSLWSTIILTGGTGTIVNPFRISSENQIITFQIYNGSSSLKFQAEENMTWYEWTNSDYNTLNLICSNLNSAPIDGNGCGIYENCSSTINSVKYAFGCSGGSGN